MAFCAGKVDVVDQISFKLALEMRKTYPEISQIPILITTATIDPKK